MRSEDVLSYLLAFGVAVLLLRVLARVASHINLVDHPNERKDHQGAVPLIGGLAMFMAFSFAVLTLAVPISHLRSFFAGAALLVLVGVLDDMRELSSAARFATQIIAALLMTQLGGVVLQNFGAIGWGGSWFELGAWSIPLSVFATVGVINALNMSDGIDGLAGSVSLLVVMALGFVAWVAGDFDSVRMLLLLATVIFAFLLFNMRIFGRKRALVFMGDAGSMFLGFVLAWFFILLSQGESRAMTPVTALWFFAVPLIDTVSQMLRRILKGRSPFAPDREHFHHALLLARYSPEQSLGIVIGISVVTSLIGLGGLYLGVPEVVMFYGFLLLFATYFLGMIWAWKVRRFLHRSISRRLGVQDRRSGKDRRQTEGQNKWEGLERRAATGGQRSGVNDRRKLK